MKWLSVILSLYLLFLAGMPCADGAGHAAHEEVAPFVEHDHNSPWGERHEHHCSPLCICSCCAGFTFQMQKCVPVPAPASGTSVEFGFVATSATSKYTGAIWHPPRH